jgi:glycosyltransferase involved in cell wall biosynthesis
MRQTDKLRLAIIISHPIQYYVPLYRRLAKRDDIEIKVFFTWHAGEQAVFDQGFRQKVAWDIPLTDGYEYEIVPNLARDPGTHHFWGLHNPTLTARVMSWRPDAVHLTGYAYASHLSAMRKFHRLKVPLFFRGDSHLLDGKGGWKWPLKLALLSAIYRWPAAFLYVGEANRKYYKALGVPDEKLHYCPHTIEVSRFVEPDVVWEEEASRWRAELGLTTKQRVLLFAGKFEDKKQPVALMKAFLELEDYDLVLIMVGDGELGAEVRTLVQAHPERFRVLPFQNQSRMPVVYRLGDLLVLPSAYQETWGMAVNEALACGRPVLVSDRVGCAADLVKPGQSGEIFRAGDWENFKEKLEKALETAGTVDRSALRHFARQFDVEVTERHLMEALIKSVGKVKPA